MAQIRTTNERTLRYILHPDREDREALADTFAGYASMMDILLELTSQGDTGGNVVKLHHLAYDEVRSRTGLPSQMVSLGLRDFTARAGGEAVEGIPLDERLYAIKGSRLLAVATVSGRLVVPYEFGGYEQGWRGSLPARLVALPTGFEIRVGVGPGASFTKELNMAHDDILTRITRLVSGIAHAALDKAERGDQVAVVEQCIRDLDKERTTLQAQLAQVLSQRHRNVARRAEIEGQLAALEGQIASAVTQDRDDLAKAGIERQIVLETLLKGIDASIDGIDDEAGQIKSSLSLIAAGRKDAEASLAQLKASLAQTPAGGPSPASRGAAATESPEARAIRSLEAIARVTGVPAQSPDQSGGQLDELERLHRNKDVSDRLAALKDKVGKADASKADGGKSEAKSAVKTTTGKSGAPANARR